MRWALAFLLLVSVNAAASMVTDLEDALQKDDVATAHAIASKMHGDWWYKNNPADLTQFDNLVDRFDALDQFNATADSYLTTKDEAQGRKAEGAFQQVIDLINSNAHQPYPVSQATIDRLKEKSNIADEKMTAMTELRKQQREEAARAKEAALQAAVAAQRAEAEKQAAEIERKLAEPAPCPKTGLYAGCPWNAKLAAHDGRFSIETMAAEIAAPLLKRYNHTPNGCGHPANRVIGAYSRYENGHVFYLHDNILVQSEVFDRVMLRDMLDKKTTLDLRKIALMDCKDASNYAPTQRTYTMPDDPLSQRQ